MQGRFERVCLGASLGVTHHTIQRRLDVLEDAFIIRRLQPWFRKVGKRLTKSPKVYLRDTGLLHHLLNESTSGDVDNHPVRGASWEGFVIEDIVRREKAARIGSSPWFWRTAAGAEVDLVLDRGHGRVAVEINAGRGIGVRQVAKLRDCLPDIGASRAWIVDQVEGIEFLGSSLARAGFQMVIDGTP